MTLPVRWRAAVLVTAAVLGAALLAPPAAQAGPQPATVVPDDEPAASPAAPLPGNGRLATYRAGGVSGIYTMDAGGQGAERVQDGEDVRSSAWSPDGQRIAFTGPLDGELVRQVWTIDADGTDRVRVTSGDRHANNPSWSPDGRWLAYSSADDNLYVVAAAGGPSRLLVDTDCMDNSSWSPDGASIFFTECDAKDIFRVASDGGSVPVRVTNTPETEQHVEVSPDGQSLAVTGWSDPERVHQHLWLISADGADRRDLYAAPDDDTVRSPYVSPDGTQVAFITGNNNGPVGPRTHLVDLGTGEVSMVASQLAEGDQEYSVSWQPVAPSDTTPPTIDVTSPSEGQLVPYGGTVALDWSCADDVAVTECSAVTKIGGVDGAHGTTIVQPGTMVGSATVPPGPYGLIVTARDAAGHQSTLVRSYTITPIDVSGRLISPGGGTLHDFGSVLTVAFACGDPVHPPDSCTATHDGVPVASGAQLPPATAGWHTIVVSAVHDPDGATRSSNTIHRYAIENRDGSHPGSCCALDATAPTIDVTAPADAAVIPQGTVATVQYACADLSGIHGCSGDLARDGASGEAVASGTSLATRPPGRYVLTVAAEDQPGNTTTRSVSFVIAAPGDTTAAVTGGETVSTGSTATAQVPTQTSIAVPAGVSGLVTVDAQPAGASPAGFALFGQQLVVEGPAATAAAPYEMSFTVDETALGGLAPSDVQVWRDGVALTGCTHPSSAVPDPCIVSRGFTPAAGDGGDALVTVRTSRFSTWTLGRLAYALEGPLQPVDAGPTLNTSKAGAAIPLRFTLGGNKGLDIFSSTPRSVVTSCGSGPKDEIEITVTATASRLVYEPHSQQYVYLWKTDRSWRGCRDLTLTFRDGSRLRTLYSLR